LNPWFWWFAFGPWLKYFYKGETKWLGDVSTKESGYLTHVAWEKLFSPDLHHATEE
jgi:hypothetical protein